MPQSESSSLNVHNKTFWILDKIYYPEGGNAQGREPDLKINVDITKLMFVCREQSKPFTLQVDSGTIKRVSLFKYLGTLGNKKWGPDLEAKSRVEYARQGFLKYKRLLCDPHPAVLVLY